MLSDVLLFVVFAAERTRFVVHLCSVHNVMLARNRSRLDVDLFATEGLFTRYVRWKITCSSY